MNADDRTLLLDLENLGARWLRPRPFRARLAALLAAAGPVHHAVAAYSSPPEANDGALASMLAEHRIAPLRVLPGPDAAELALLAHAHHVHAAGGRVFLVGSADHRLAEVADLGRVELLVWDNQPIASKLADIAFTVHRLPRPNGTPTADAEDLLPRQERVRAPIPPSLHPGAHDGPGSHALAALATGIGIAIGHHGADAVVRWLRRHS